MALLAGMAVLQAAHGAPPVALRALDFAGQMARLLGARVIAGPPFASNGSFLGRGKEHAAPADPVAWARGQDKRLLLVAGERLAATDYAGCASVLCRAEPLSSEATLFADSGIADLLGDPQGAPIIPRGDYGAGTAGYGLLAALCALATRLRRFGKPEVALANLSGILAWVNWKAAILGDLGAEISRQGEAAEWPVLPCADGHVALVYQERDWPALVKMLGDPRLEDERFGSFQGRARHRAEYMDIIRAWAQGQSKRALMRAFLKHEIPAAPVMTEADLLADPLLAHRRAFAPATGADGVACRTPVLAHRIPCVEEAASNDEEPATKKDKEPLPLAGLRVLDLGIITAGAGVGALLADLGAEVLKVESQTYPDPFRQWAGEEASPLFVSNNRNKHGIALDLKTKDGKASFLELVKTADVLVENFRRGVLDRLGLDYATLKAVNPRLVLASISGQGLTGPGCQATSFGSTLEASSGFAANVRYEDGSPWITGRNLNYPDQTVALYAAAVITAALADRRRGMQLDIAQRDVAVFLAGEAIESTSAGKPPAPQDNGRCHQAKDGAWIAVGVPADQASAARLIAQHDAQSALCQLREAGLPAAQVKRGSEMHESFKTSWEFARTPEGALVKGFPFQFAGESMSVHLEAPEIGEHTALFASSQGDSP